MIKLENNQPVGMMGVLGCGCMIYASVLAVQYISDKIKSVFTSDPSSSQLVGHPNSEKEKRATKIKNLLLEMKTLLSKVKEEMPAQEITKDEFEEWGFKNRKDAVEYLDDLEALVNFDEFEKDIFDEFEKKIYGIKDDLKDFSEFLTEKKLLESETLLANEDLEKALKARSRSLKENLSKIVVGQDAAVDAISDAICLRMAKLDDPNKPIAKMLFVGATGVGKTEMAKAVASEFFGNPASILSINVPEYTIGLGVSRLIGSPAGFEGYTDGGLLTNFVQKNPYSVILIDEVEKGTPDIMDLFLKILDEGSIQDAQGKTADFKNTMIIFTSNAGAAENKVEQAVKKQFRPEFLGRLNKVITFNPISEEMSNKIVDLELEKLQKRAKAEGMNVRITQKLRTYIYAKVFQNSTGKGAREIKQIISHSITTPLARQALSLGPVEEYFLDIKGHNLIGHLKDQEDVTILASLEDPCKDELLSLKERALSLKETLSKIVIGQDAAVDAVSDAICLRMAKLDDPNKPIAKLLFVGATGVGKTEMAKAVASEFFGNPASILSINVPEYTNESGVARLIGSSAGLVGYTDGGLLTNFVQRNPKSVILIDEVEKGTPAIMDLFLKILDEGSIQDAQGETTDFKNTVIILTSNVGAAENRIEQAVKKQFRPEFLGRLNGVVTFNSISQEMSNKIIDLELEKLQNRAKAEGRKVEISEECRNLLYDQIYRNSTGKGAREIKNTIATFITKPLSREMMFSNSTEKSYLVDVVDNKYVIRRQDILANC
ncbi:MAG: AAA family ATPase [Chlamydiota bacterium]